MVVAADAIVGSANAVMPIDFRNKKWEKKN